jgi:hypothetical protein
MKLLWIISVDFNITEQLLMRSSAFVRYRRKNETIHRLFIHFKKAYDSMREVLDNILVWFEIPMKIDRLTKMLASYVITNCGYCGDLLPVACV